MPATGFERRSTAVRQALPSGGLVDACLLTLVVPSFFAYYYILLQRPRCAVRGFSGGTLP
jgi:hypothetical protein